MSSSQRSSSGVRNLRAVFENPEGSDSLSPSRGRSPSGSVNGSISADRSPASSVPRKVRTSFISVEPSGKLLAENSDLSNRRRPSRMSSSQTLDNDVSVDAAPVPTPIVGLSASTSAAADNNAAANAQPMQLPNDELQSEHPEKVVSAVEDEDATLLPGDVTDEQAVSGGEALADESGKSPEQLSNNISSTATSNPLKAAPALSGSKQPTKPIATTKASASKTSNVKSPTQKSPTATKPKPKSPTRPVRLSSHLTQPTASYAAKHEPEQQVTTKPRSASGSQKAIGVSSHLMAPTAASKAKHEPEPPVPAKVASSRPRASLLPNRDRTSLAGSSDSSANRMQATKPTRSSLAKAANESPPQAEAKPLSEGFLARMTKPTSSSTNKSHDKTEAKEPSRPAAASAGQSSASARSGQPAAAKPSTTKPAASAKGKQPASKSPTISRPAKASTSQSASGATKAPTTAPVPSTKKDTPTAKATAAEATTPTATTTAEETATAGGEAVISGDDAAASTIETQPSQRAAEAIEPSTDVPPVGTGETNPSATVNGTAETSTPPQASATKTVAEWNPAALPQTPLSKQEDTAKSGMNPVDQGRRSMMETPELEGAVIH